jgi:hypothetical protein
LLKIRDYFGEKIALYFAWLEFYTSQLRYPTIAGILVFLVSQTVSSLKGPALSLFAAFISMWATYQTEMWKRRNALLNLWWGSFGATDDESAAERAQFTGVLRRNPKNDVKETYHKDLRKRRLRMCVSATALTLLVLVFLMGTLACFYLKWFFNTKEPGGMGQIYAGIANAGVIAMGNEVALMLAKKLANAENHRTQHMYENQYNLYTFTFRFVVTYAAFFYTAFIKRWAEGGCINEKVLFNEGLHDEYEVINRSACMAELRIQVATIFIATFCGQNAWESGKPTIYFTMRRLGLGVMIGDKQRAATKAEEQIEEELLYEPYEEKESMKDYAELVIQYGFVVLFVAAFPITPLLALINNIFEPHIDAYKLCTNTRRPSPHISDHIGLWGQFMAILSNVAVLTNIGLVLFTSDIFHHKSLSWKLVVFIGKHLLFSFCYSSLSVALLFFFCLSSLSRTLSPARTTVAEHLMMIFKFVLSEVVPDEPAYVTTLKARHDFVINRLFNAMEQDSDDHLVEEVRPRTCTDCPCTAAA